MKEIRMDFETYEYEVKDYRRVGYNNCLRDIILWIETAPHINDGFAYFDLSCYENHHLKSLIEMINVYKCQIDLLKNQLEDKSK